MGLVCGTPTRFMSAAAANAAADTARTAQGTTITPALGAGVKKGTNLLGMRFVYGIGNDTYSLYLLVKAQMSSFNTASESL